VALSWRQRLSVLRNICLPGAGGRLETFEGGGLRRPSRRGHGGALLPDFMNPGSVLGRVRLAPARSATNLSKCTDALGCLPVAEACPFADLMRSRLESLAVGPGAAKRILPRLPGRAIDVMTMPTSPSEGGRHL